MVSGSFGSLVFDGKGYCFMKRILFAACNSKGFFPQRGRKLAGAA